MTKRNDRKCRDWLPMVPLLFLLLSVVLFLIVKKDEKGLYPGNVLKQKSSKWKDVKVALTFVNIAREAFPLFAQLPFITTTTINHHYHYHHPHPPLLPSGSYSLPFFDTLQNVLVTFEIDVRKKKDTGKMRVFFFFALFVCSFFLFFSFF